MSGATHLRQIRRTSAAIVAGAGVLAVGTAVALNDDYSAQTAPVPPVGPAPAIGEPVGFTGWVPVSRVRRTGKPPHSTTEAS